MNPMMVKTTSLERKSSGVRLMFLKLRRIRIHVSERKEFENFGLRCWVLIGLVVGVVGLM